MKSIDPATPKDRLDARASRERKRKMSSSSVRGAGGLGWVNV